MTRASNSRFLVLTVLYKFQLILPSYLISIQKSLPISFFMEDKASQLLLLQYLEIAVVFAVKFVGLVSPC